MGFEQLKNILDENKAQIELDREEAMNPTECPDDGFALKTNSKGERSCEFCGRVYK